MAGQLINTPELCLSFCEGSGPAAVYMTYRPPYTYTYSYGDDYHDPGGCSCRSIGQSADDSHGAISASACRTECLADESTRQWTNQIRITGYEYGIDYSHNNVPSTTIHGVADHIECEEHCSSASVDAVVFSYSRCTRRCECDLRCR